MTATAITRALLVVAARCLVSAVASGAFTTSCRIGVDTTATDIAAALLVATTPFAAPPTTFIATALVARGA
ncbi:MAG: hypothetical protein SFX73_05715 [Kofleriaceae bacterium]|nr:hypothetical protein [Kofleriaceae bacterium]